MARLKHFRINKQLSFLNASLVFDEILINTNVLVNKFTLKIISSGNSRLVEFEAALLSPMNENIILGCHPYTQLMERQAVFGRLTR